MDVKEALVRMQDLAEQVRALVKHAAANPGVIPPEALRVIAESCEEIERLACEARMATPVATLERPLKPAALRASATSRS